VTPSPLGRHGRLISLLITLSLALSLACATTAQAQTGQAAGVQAHLMWGGVDGPEVDRQLDKVKESGATMIRVDTGWASIEPDGKGQYSEWYLSRLDSVLSKAQARGIKVLVTLWETPCWASKAPESLKQGCAGQWWGRNVQRYAPVNPSDYADAVAYVVRRFKGRVAAWELWNEPNDASYFISDDPVGEYAALVKAAYPAAKAADPDSTILAGSLAHADFGWTKRLLDKGVGGNFDGWSVHPYSGPNSPLSRGDDNWIQATFIRGVPAVRQTLLQYGQDKPLWLTEFGWSTCSVRSGGEEWARCIDPNAQADFVRQALDQMRAWDYVKAAFYFKLKDTSADGADRNTNYGLLRSDGSEKPAFAAFAGAARQMGSPGTDATPAGSGSGSGSSSGSGTRSGTASGSASGTGRTATTALPAKPTSRRVTLAVLRAARRLVVRGKGPSGQSVKISAYRYIAAKKRFAVKASHTVLVKVDAAGRYERVFKKKSLSRGRWRIVATLAGDDARLARVDIGKNR
jgi:hypothetical protein